MKKLLTIVLCVSILAMAGCSKHDTANSGQIKYIRVTVPAPPQNRTAVDGDTYTTFWTASDAIRLTVKTADGATSDYRFTADNGGSASTSFTGELPESMIGNVISVAACYPYSEHLTFDWNTGSWEISENFLYGQLDSLACYDLLYAHSTEASLEYTDEGRTEAELKASISFKPLLARIHVTIPPEYTLDTFTLEADQAVFPTYGTIDPNGNFTATASTHVLPFSAASHDFYVGVLPFTGAATTVSAFHTETNWPMEGLTFSVGELKSNTFYTLDISSATLKPFKLDNIPDEIAELYGEGTAHKDSIFSPQDRTGYINGWLFFFAEIKQAGDGSSDILNDMDRFMLQTNPNAQGTDTDHNYGALATAPIYFDDAASRTVKVSFTAACNQPQAKTFMVATIEPDVEITEEQLSNKNGMADYRIGNVSPTPRDVEYTFEITSGMRIIIAGNSGNKKEGFLEIGNLNIEFPN